MILDTTAQSERVNECTVMDGWMDGWRKKDETMKQNEDNTISMHFMLEFYSLHEPNKTPSFVLYAFFIQAMMALGGVIQTFPSSFFSLSLTLAWFVSLW